MNRQLIAMILFLFSPVTNLDELVKQTSSRASYKQNSVTSSTVPPSSPAWTLNSPSTTIQKLFVQAPDPYYCRYCNVRCNSHIQLEKHRSSKEHIININSDSDRQWNYNPPPWNFQDGQYQLCQKWGIYLIFQFSLVSFTPGIEVVQKPSRAWVYYMFSTTARFIQSFSANNVHTSH